MLKRLQLKYAELPVRFLLVPCNEFEKQEPKSNADVKAFAETYVDLSRGSNILMLAKSNLNGVPCTATGADTCTASSRECCGQNDPIYDYLLANTPPGKIHWNFDKIVVDKFGRPFKGETIFHGGDLDAAVESAIASASNGLRISAAAHVSDRSGFVLVLVFAGAVIAAVMGLRWRQRRTETQKELALQLIMLT